ncbi:MAG: LacI family DNA-binding transcriptional regulator [Rhizobiaceae bacterium]
MTLLSRRKGPTIQAIADIASVGTATVDRVLNSRTGVREKTRRRVIEALDKLASEETANLESLDIRLFCESGDTFNEAMAAAVEIVNRTRPGVKLAGQYVRTSQLEADRFSSQIISEGGMAEGVILVAREHPAINRAVRHLRSENLPVVCLTTDLPSSRRNAYVGNDQYAAGSVAGQLIGHACKRQNGRILLAMSVSFRCQQEREMGFRRTLRADFPHLRIEERLISDDEPGTTYDQLRRYFDEHGVPDAIYNVSGGNRGVAQALRKLQKTGDTIFVGHELTPISRGLLEAGTMDYVISHNFADELSRAAEYIRDFQVSKPPDPAYSQILVHMKYNCDL